MLSELGHTHEAIFAARVQQVNNLNNYFVAKFLIMCCICYRPRTSWHFYLPRRDEIDFCGFGMGTSNCRESVLVMNPCCEEASGTRGDGFRIKIDEVKEARKVHGVIRERQNPVKGFEKDLEMLYAAT